MIISVVFIVIIDGIMVCVGMKSQREFREFNYNMINEV